MDYAVGSVAALISGNVTPNRPKLIRRALTPTKHPASPNVTPKSEFVEDRSIFLSPTMQKKKAIVKKSPKRIFQNPDLDNTENNEGVSPKAEKVKKHLKDKLEAENEGESSVFSKKSPSSKLEKSLQLGSPSKKSKINDSQISNENTPKKKKKKLQQEIKSGENEEMDIDQPTAAAETDGKSPKKMKQKRKSTTENTEQNLTEEVTKQAEEPLTEVNSQGKKKKNKKRKKQNKQNQETKNTDDNNKLPEETTEQNSPAKKKHKNKKKKAKQSQVERNERIEATDQDHEELEANDQDKEITQSKVKKTLTQSSDEDLGAEDSEDDDEISNIANPNAITAKDSDSEHDSDDEIESENEEINDEVLKKDVESSDDEEEKPKMNKKQKQSKKEGKNKEKQNEKEDNQESSEDEIKRTLFVGNVPFSEKCKKEIKKIFDKYGVIETVRIRTVPVKDARVTPKLAVIKNEIHPERSTVNVYVKFAHADSVNLALAENNTVLNKHHLRVSRSDSTGMEHNPQLAVFLGNLPFGVEDETLRAKFEKCGPIESIRIVRDKKTNAGKGFGYINFASKDGVELALLLKEEDLTIKNRIIRVKRCTNTNKALKKSTKPGKKFGNSFGNNQGQNRNFGNNQGQNRNFGNNQGQNRNFGNNQGQNRNFGSNQGQRNFGNNQGQNRNFGNNQGQRSFGNNQGQNRFGNQGANKFGNQGNELSGASRRLMNKRPHQESGDGPPNKKQNLNQPIREKKQRKEFVGMTAEKKKKHKFDKGQKKKKILSEILTKK